MDNSLEDDHINENECLVVGLKHTFPDPDEREKMMNALVGEWIELLADPTNVIDQYSILCFYNGRKIGFIAHEFCRKFYNHLDYEGHGKAHIVRLGKRTCLVARLEPIIFPRPGKDHDFPLQDDTHLIPFESSEQSLDHSYQFLKVKMATFRSMLQHTFDYSQDEWVSYLSALLNSLQNFTQYYKPSPCIEDRDHLHEVISFCVSVIKLVEKQLPESDLLPLFDETRRNLQTFKTEYLGNKQYSSIAKQHYDHFLQQALTYRYAERYLRQLKEICEHPSQEQLKTERSQAVKMLRAIDPIRADFYEFDDIEKMADFIFYCRLSRSELYLLYKYIFRVTLLNQWIQMAASGREIQVEVKVYGKAEIRVEGGGHNNFQFESGSEITINAQPK